MLGKALTNSISGEEDLLVTVALLSRASKWQGIIGGSGYPADFHCHGQIFNTRLTGLLKE